MISVSPYGRFVFEDKGHIFKVIAAMFISALSALQHQSLLDPWYIEFISCLNNCQTKTAKGVNIILLSNWGKAKDNPRDNKVYQGQLGWQQG